MCERLPACPKDSTALNDNFCTCTGSLIASRDLTSCVDANANPFPGPNYGETSCQSNQVYRGNPINVGTGNKTQVEVDYLAPSGLQFKRIYNSQSAYEAPSQFAFGQGSWRAGIKRSIEGLPFAPPPTPPISTTVCRLGTCPAWIVDLTVVTAFVSRGDGKVYTYNRSGNLWQSSADVNGQLSSQFDTAGKLSSWTYTTEDQDVEQYDATGQLISVTNRTSQITTLSYSDGTVNLPNGGYILDATGAPTINTLPSGLLIRVTDAYQRSLSFGYDASSRIARMTDPAGGVYNYTYDPNGNLSAVTYPDGKKKQYLYENPTYLHALTGIIDENGNRYATYTYDTNGRAISTEHAGGAERVAITYNGDGSADITDALGTVRHQTFQTVQGVVKNGGFSQPGGSGCGSASSNLTYDPNGNVTSRTDFKGTVTTYTYDLARNLETSRTEAFGTPEARTITTQWHSTHRLPTVITESLRSTTYTYDAKGNLLTLSILPTGGAGKPRVTTYTYNTFGQVLAVDGPRADVSDTTRYIYGPQGNLISVSNALNQTTTLGGYDLNGRVGNITNPNGLTTTLSYDPRGRLTTRTVGTELTRYTYDSAGNLTGVTLPNGALYTYTYDQAHRLIQIADAQNNRIVYTLDNAGNRTREETFDNNGNLIQTHSRVFDALNRLWQDIGAVNQTTTYTYDANGNLTSVLDPLNRLSTNQYDALNRLNQVANPDLGIIKYAYDPQNQLIAVTDPRNNITQYQRDGLGNLNQTISPDTGSTNATYDEAGNLKTKLDAKGQLATYSYDALNRLTNIAYTAGAGIAFNVTYLYDQGPNGAGHLTGLLDNTGVTQYTYDQKGRLTSETRQGAGNGLIYTTGYSYDPLGRLNTTTYPSGRTVNYSHDPMGRISTISTTDASSNTTVIASNIQYRPFGGVQSYTYGDGQVAQPQLSNRQYDQDGRIASYLLNGQLQIIGYDAASQISFINNMGGPITPPSLASYTYDTMSRLTGYTQDSTNHSYTYDQVGNRTGQLIGSTTTNYGYDPMSNKLSSIQSGAGAPQIVTQDAIGATTSDAAHQYAYDIRGRLIQATTAQGQINYEVNALGLRVRKQVPYANTDTQYHYDTQGHLIGENTTGTTQFSREYIWLGDIPVAVMQ